MSITGNLATMELTEVLQWLAQGQKTGTLVIDSGRIEKKIFFKNGIVISCASSDPAEYLGHFLVSHGFITEAQLAEAIGQQERTKTLLGRILVGKGWIAEKDLDRMLQLKAEESIFEIFHWKEGNFGFRDDDLPTWDMVPISLNVTSLLLEGLQRIDEWGRIRELVTSRHAIPVSVVDLRSAAEEDERTRRVMDLVDDNRTVEEICLETHASEFFVSKTLWELARQRRVKMVRPRVLGTALATTATVGGVGLVELARTHLVAGRLEQAWRHAKAARSLEPDNRGVVEAAKAIEERLRTELTAAGVVPGATPLLAVSMAELTKLDVSPEAGFILSRINGTYTVESILKISPMAELDALVVLWRLIFDGQVTISASTAPTTS